MYTVTAPLTFLNVTGVVTKSCDGAARGLSLVHAARHPRSAPRELSYPSLGWFWRCVVQGAAGDEDSVAAGAGVLASGTLRGGG